MFPSPWLMRRRVVDGEAERSFFAHLCLKEFQRVVGKQIRCIGFVFVEMTVCHDGHVEIVGAAVRHGVPRVETASWFEAVAEMPLARQAGVVAAIAKQLRVCRHPEQELNAVRRHLAVEPALACIRLPHQSVVHPMLRWNSAGQNRRPGRRADRRGAEEIVEADSFPRQPVQVGRPDFRIAGTTHGPRALVIGQNEQEIGLVGTTTGHGHRCLRRSSASSKYRRSARSRTLCRPR